MTMDPHLKLFRELFQERRGAQTKRFAFLRIRSEVACRESAVWVVGETDGSYWIEVDQRIRLAGHCRFLDPGQTMLVPKISIRLAY